MKTYKFPIEALLPHQIFVFGSNTQGRHGKGAALTAKQKFGAVYGQKSGFQGQSYAIITKDISKHPHQSMSQEYIIGEIYDLYKVALSMPHIEFLIAYHGSKANLNGYTPKEMAKMFISTSIGTIPGNIVFEESFASLIEEVLASLIEEILNEKEDDVG